MTGKGTKGVETGLCFFADQQTDRSFADSCVTARIAAAHVRGILNLGDGWTYNSVVSNTVKEGGFTGLIQAEITTSGI
jgi:trans-L-3-hydroxyproline dehydratase